MVQCYDCKGKGYQIFLGNETGCKPCNNTGELIACASYALPPNAVLGFRNQKCHHCGVRQNDHKVAEVKA